MADHVVPTEPSVTVVLMLHSSIRLSKAEKTARGARLPVRVRATARRLLLSRSLCTPPLRNGALEAGVSDTLSATKPRRRNFLSAGDLNGRRLGLSGRHEHRALASAFRAGRSSSTRLEECVPPAPESGGGSTDAAWRRRSGLQAGFSTLTSRKRWRTSASRAGRLSPNWRPG